MIAITDLAPEVLSNVFSYIDPTDLAALAQTCKELESFIRPDGLLWKTQYLGIFDEPSSDDFKTNEEWKPRVCRMIQARQILKSQDVGSKRSNLEQVVSAAIELMTKSTRNPDQNIKFLHKLFSDPANVSAFICQSSLFKEARYQEDFPASTEDLRQLSAQLHVYYGLEVEPSRSDDILCSSRPVHPFARSRVYDLRRYNQDNKWGPFTDDGTFHIDWEKVQAIMTVIAFNARMYFVRRSGRFDSLRRPTWRHFPLKTGYLAIKPFHGLAPHSYISKSLNTQVLESVHPELMARDPFNVTGTWIRIVCFLDYRDFRTFNFGGEPVADDQERDPICTREAFRLIKMQLQITSIEDPGPEDDPTMPVVRFKGKAKAIPISGELDGGYRVSDMKGTVRKLRSGVIRWTTFSIFNVEERWRTEAVQIGGIQSARGALGNWFDKDYDEQGPAGPTAFWKVSDEISDDDEILRANGGLGSVFAGNGVGAAGMEDSDGSDEEGEGEGADDDDDDEDEDDDNGAENEAVGNGLATDFGNGTVITTEGNLLTTTTASGDTITFDISQLVGTGGLNMVTATLWQDIVNAVLQNQ